MEVLTTALRLKHWYKILGVLLFAYVLIAGMIVPIKQGIYTVTPASIKANQQNKILIEGYNTHFAESDTEVWLKVDSLHGIQASNIRLIDENYLEAEFDLDGGFGDVRRGVLMVHNERDGTSILPNLFLGKGESENQVNEAKLISLSKLPYDRFKARDGWYYPFLNDMHETIRNTFFHVAIWMAMFGLALVAFIFSIKELIKHDPVTDAIASSFTSIAILFGLIGIATGSIWARFTWGAFWTADVKLNMAAVSILIYIAYLVLRASIQDMDQRARVSAAYNVFAFVAMIPLIFVIPRLTDSLHPGNGGNPALGGEDLDNSLRMVFYPAVIAFFCLGTWIANLRIRVLNLQNKLLDNSV